MIAKGNDFNYTPAPVGMHVAVCVKLIDLGTQTTSWQGTETSKRQILMSWELSNEKHVFDAAKGEEPFVLTEKYTLSLADKAQLRAMLKGWRGRDFTADELKGFDLKNVLGKPCMVNVIHKKSVDGTKTFTNVANVTPMPKGMEIPKQITPSVYFSLDEFDAQVFETFSDKLKEKIASSPEYKKINNVFFSG